MIDQPAERVSSTIRYTEGLKAKMEELMRTGDILDSSKRTRMSSECAEKVCRRAFKLWRGGASMSEAASLSGGNYQTFRKWLIRHNHHQPQPR